MLPPCMVQANEKCLVKKVYGSDKMRQHILDLGFVENAELEVVCNQGRGCIIVKMNDTRLALDKKTSTKILVDIKGED